MRSRILAAVILGQGAVLGLLTPRLAVAQPCGEAGIVQDPVLATPTCMPLAFALDGERKEFHANGQVRYVHTVVDTKRDGATTWTYANGQEAIQGSYLDDRRHGKWMFWTPDGRPWEQGSYDRGKPVGVWRRWINGEARPERHFVDGVDAEQCPAGTMPALVRHEEVVAEASGRPAPQDRLWGYASFCLTEEGARHGPFIDHDGDGARRFEGAYHHGQRHGEWRRWEEPDVWEQQLWVRGKRDAEWERWAHGLRTGQYRYRRGQRHGLQREWHLNGQLALKISYKKGAPHGSVEQWYDNGQPELSGSFNRGARAGTWTAWLVNGQLRRRGVYAKGQRIGVWTYWHDNGNLYLSGPYKKNRKHGKWIFWHDNGQMGQRGECRRGKGVGRWQEWSPEGEQRRDVDYAELVEELWEAEYPCGELPFVETAEEEPVWAF